jgi:uncharacterized protein (TIGR00369 family)
MTIDEANRLCEGMLPGTLGIRFEQLEPGHAVTSLEARREVLSPNGFLHGGTVVALADTACGFGTFVTPGPERNEFATVDLSCNFIGTALEGRVTCTARLVHGGRTTQVWDAAVEREDGRTIAVFRATQLLLARVGLS